VGIDSLEIHDPGISHIWKAPLVAGGECRKGSSFQNLETCVFQNMRFQNLKLVFFVPSMEAHG
jgi:hypothetical protein